MIYFFLPFIWLHHLEAKAFEKLLSQLSDLETVYLTLCEKSGNNNLPSFPCSCYCYFHGLSKFT